MFSFVDSTFHAVWAPLAQAADAAGTSITDGLVERLLDSWVVSATLLVLVVMSLSSWFIIAYKWAYFRRVRAESRAFVEAFWQSAKLDAIYRRADELQTAPVSKVFKAGYVELNRVREASSRTSEDGLHNVERALKRATQQETMEMERWVPVLATTGTAAPFIGLFGTVWGIMEAFAQLGSGNRANLLDTVVPHIAEALVATAIGLLAAIPAVMAYNFFVRKIRVSLVEIEAFSAEFLNIVQRHFFSG